MKAITNDCDGNGNNYYIFKFQNQWRYFIIAKSKINGNFSAVSLVPGGSIAEFDSREDAKYYIKEYLL